YVEGRPLKAEIPEGGMPVDSVRRYGVQIASALSHAHQRGVIHCDLKSSNVIITPEGSAKVLDFGLARRMAEQLTEETRSQVLIAGTLHYLAPEVLRGQRPDARGDIWALGVLLCQMATGQLPFQGSTSFELTSAILRDTAPNLLGGLGTVVSR